MASSDTQAAASAAAVRPIPSDATFAVALDCTSLSATAAFYNTALGFAPIGKLREGLIFQEVHLESPQVRGVRIILREAFGKRPIGTQPGSVLRLAFQVPSMKAVIDRFGAHVIFAGNPPAPDATSTRLLDPDGYIVEIYQDAPGSGF
ncbi:MAG: VOC family protein [Phycisphaerales bacterium]|nr:VOC family protein [Phycisphaerales bacterium]